MLTKKKGHELIFFRKPSSVNEASWDSFFVILIISSLFDLDNKTNSNLLYKEQQIEIPKFQFENPKKEKFPNFQSKTLNSILKRNHTEMASLENQIFVRFVGDDDSVLRRRWWNEIGVDILWSSPPWERSKRRDSPPWERSKRRGFWFFRLFYLW